MILVESFRIESPKFTLVYLHSLNHEPHIILRPEIQSLYTFSELLKSSNFFTILYNVIKMVQTGKNEDDGATAAYIPSSGHMYLWL